MRTSRAAGGMLCLLTLCRGLAIAEPGPPPTAALTATNKAAPSVAAPDLDAARKQFEANIRDVQRQRREAAKALQQRYLAGLTALEEALQSAGNQLPAMLAVRGEKARFEQSGDIPTSALSAEWPALQKLQLAWRTQTAGGAREQAQKIVAASERYLQNLTLMQKDLAARQDTGSVDAVNAEKERVLGNNLVHEALALQQAAASKSRDPSLPPVREPEKPPEPAPPIPAATVVELGGYKFYPPGKEPLLKDLHPLRLEFPSADQRLTQLFYDLRVAITSAKADLSGNPSLPIYAARGGNPGHGGSPPRAVIRTKPSNIASIPRITLAARSHELPEGCKMVLEYFSQPSSRANDLRREKVEQIPLPPLPRSRAYTVDARGIALSKNDFYDSNSGHHTSGREFYGLIVSLFDAANNLLLQQCAPSTLAAQCNSKPAEPDQF